MTKPLEQGDCWRPAKMFTGQANIWPALHRVVRRQRIEGEPRRAVREFKHGFCKLTDGEFAGFAQVYRAGDVGPRCHQAKKAVDQVALVAEAAGRHPPP